MEPFGTIWNHLEPYGTIWNHFEPFRTIWNQFQVNETLNQRKHCQRCARAQPFANKYATSRKTGRKQNAGQTSDNG